MRVWITRGEHFSTPGTVMTVHATEASANAAAAELVNIMLADTGDVLDKPDAANAENWDTVGEWLGDYHGHAHCWVDVSDHAVVEG